MMKSIFLTLSLFALGNILWSQTEIKGQVTSENGSPIYHAILMLEGSFDGCFSDEFGNYVLTTALTGDQILVVKNVGYETQKINLHIPSQLNSIDVVLKELTSELNTVTISAGTFEAGDKTKSVSLSSLDMITVPGAQGNVVGALNYLPGTSTNGESGKLFVRGGSSDESQTYIDGALVPVPYNPSAPNTAVRSKFNPFMFDGTIFSTGGYSAEYGQALSSVLLLETKGVQEEDQFDISIMSVGLGLAGTKKWTKSAITLSADYTNLGPYMKIVPQNIEWIKSPNSLNLGLNYRYKTNKGLFKLYSSYGQTALLLNQPNLNTNGTLSRYTLSNKNYYANFNYVGSLGKSWILKASSSYTYNIDQIAIDQNQYDTEMNFGHLKTVLSRKLSKQVKVHVGGEMILRKYAQKAQSDDLIFYTGFDEIAWGAFSEIELKLAKKWAGRIGARLDRSELTNQTKLAPRASIAYKSGNNSQLSMAYGSFYQQVKDDFLVYTTDLNFERADQYMLNYQYGKNQRTIRAEIFLKSYQNLIKFSDDPYYLPSHYTNLGEGYASGFDLFYRDKKTIRHGDYWISYSFLDTKRNYLNFPSSSTPSFASKHNFAVVYKHWVSKWRSYFGAAYNYASPRVYNDPNVETFNNEQMRAYHSLNINWTFLYRENVIFYSSISNVTGYKQEFGYRFSSVPNNEGVYTKQLIQPAAPRFFVMGCFITLSKDSSKNQLDKIYP